MKYTTRFYPIYAGASNALEALYQQKKQSPVSLLALYPATELLSFFLSVFSQTEAEISRVRELNADKTAQLHLCTPLQAGAALVKVHAYGPLFQEVQLIQENFAHEAKGYSNLCDIFEDIANTVSPEELKTDLMQNGISSPMDSHPLLAEKLAFLGTDTEQALKDGLTIACEKANRLINQVEEVEKKMSDISNIQIIRALKTYKEE